MATYDKVWSKTRKEPTTKAEFYKLTGITPDLIEFLDEFIDRPEKLNSLSSERQQQIEAQMDAVFASLASKHSSKKGKGDSTPRLKTTRLNSAS